MTFLTWAARALASLALLASGTWAALALDYRLPFGPAGRTAVAVLWGLFALSALVLLWRGAALRALLAYAVGLSGLLAWWGGIQPSNDRDWADDVSRPLVAQVDGDTVTLQNVRHFDWRSDTDYTPRWETRRYALSRLRTVDMALSYWMGPAIAHTLVSFGFEKEGGGIDRVVFSIEIRKERGESFSAIAGFFKQYELALVAADERDVLRVRTNVRGEDVHLYSIAMPQAAMRSLFLAYAQEAGTLARTPRFYDTLTANCTTIVYEMARRIVDGLPADPRLIASGYLPEYLHDVGGLVPGYSVTALREAGRITARAKAADADPAFSEAIRQGVPMAAKP